MCDFNSDFKNYVQYDKGKKVVYVKFLGEIYGCIESDMLWYNLYVKILKYLGFSINPYDRYGSNKIINGKQCTIVWYVGDNKLSYLDPNVVTDILE